MVLKAVELELIVRRLRAAHPGIYIAHTPGASPEIVLRVWLRASAAVARREALTADRARAFLGDLFATPVRGIRGIIRASAEKATRTRVGAGGALSREPVYVVKTSGTNLFQAAMHGALDTSLAVSTSIGDTFALLGVEAARAKIVSETQAFMADNAPNVRHLDIYADEMTRTGRVTSVERGGLSAREHANVLLRMAYVDPIRVAVDAALTGARSKVYGIAAHQLLGAVPQIGTLYNKFVVDEEFVAARVRTVDSLLDEI